MDDLWVPSQLMDGTWTEGSGGSVEVINPFDASVIETVGHAGPQDVERAVAAARAWPRAEVYGEGVLSWTAFIFIGLVTALGMSWYFLRGRDRVGTLPEHLARRLDVDPTAEGSQA